MGLTVTIHCTYEECSVHHESSAMKASERFENSFQMFQLKCPWSMIQSRGISDLRPFSAGRHFFPPHHFISHPGAHSPSPEGSPSLDLSLALSPNLIYFSLTNRQPQPPASGMGFSGLTEVQLKSVTMKKCVYADNGGSMNVTIDRDIVSSGETFRLRVVSIKSMIGYLLGATGGMEAVAIVQAIRTGWVHPNINQENSDQGVDTKVLLGLKKERLNNKAALSNSFGFGSSSIMFAPYK